MRYDVKTLAMEILSQDRTTVMTMAEAMAEATRLMKVDLSDRYRAMDRPERN